MNSADLATYAQAKGYDPLTSIDPKEGFGSMRGTAFTVIVPSLNGLMLGSLTCRKAGIWRQRRQQNTCAT